MSYARSQGCVTCLAGTFKAYRRKSAATMGYPPALARHPVAAACHLAVWLQQPTQQQEQQQEREQQQQPAQQQQEQQQQEHQPSQEQQQEQQQEQEQEREQQEHTQELRSQQQRQSQQEQQPSQEQKGLQLEQEEEQHKLQAPQQQLALQRASKDGNRGIEPNQQEEQCLNQRGLLSRVLMANSSQQDEGQQDGQEDKQEQGQQAQQRLLTVFKRWHVDRNGWVKGPTWQQLTELPSSEPLVRERCCAVQAIEEEEDLDKKHKGQQLVVGLALRCQQAPGSWVSAMWVNAGAT